MVAIYIDFFLSNYNNVSDCSQSKYTNAYM